MQFIIRKIILGVIFFAVLVSLIAVARGYRFNLSQRELSSTGILVANSSPDGAKVFVNGELKGATNSTIIVQPGDYRVEIKKDGYTSWAKDLKIKGELVVKVDALLFPQNPSLAPVTSLGLNSAISSHSGDKIVIISETGDPEKDGIYVFENVRNPLTRINPVKLLILKSSFPESTEFSLSNARLEFSPDEEQILVSIYDVQTDLIVTTDEETDPELPESRTLRSIYLIDTGSLTESPFNVTESVRTIRNAWDEQEAEIRQKQISALKKPLRDIADASFNILAFSPDEEKIMYIASQSATLPLVIDPPLPATNQTPEERELTEGSIYIYDQEEDKNFRIFGSDAFDSIDAIRGSILWYPDSAHYILKEDAAVSVVDYDGTNKRTVYAGPFQKDFLATSKDGKLFILTNLSGQFADMYSVGLQL